MADPILFFADDSDHYFLSNFYPYPLKSKKKSWKPLDIRHAGFLWPTSEHLYQALKFRADTMHERAWRALIRSSNTPTIAKYLGHQSTHCQYAWQKKLSDLVEYYRPLVRPAGSPSDLQFKKAIMLETCRAKFSLPELRERLKQTGNRPLAEDSSDDWGVRGGNMLGQVLEQVRSELV